MVKGIIGMKVQSTDLTDGPFWYIKDFALGTDESTRYFHLKDKKPNF